MRTATWAMALLVLAGFLAACATAPPPPPVAVIGSSNDLGIMAGEWHGEYWSAATGRRGTIRFTLQADTGAAWGDVWMFPAEPRGTATVSDGARAGGAAVPLQVRFVRVNPGGGVSGTIEPYRDPECDCTLSTTFVGEVAGDRIEGTYTTRGGPAHLTTTGNWEARRHTP